MSMKKRHFVACSLLIAIFLFGCKSGTANDPIKTDLDFTNQQIKLFTFDYDNSYTTSDIIVTEIWDVSGNLITFPNDYNIRIFEKSNKGWIEIFEKPTTRLPQGDFTIDPVNEDMCSLTVAIYPDLPEVDRKYYLRIFVFGKMSQDGEENDVAAYVDVVLRP
jgi:hypothetical protein